MFKPQANAANRRLRTAGSIYVTWINPRHSSLDAVQIFTIVISISLRGSQRWPVRIVIRYRVTDASVTSMLGALGAQVRVLREQRGLTLERLSELSGVSSGLG